MLLSVARLCQVNLSGSFLFYLRTHFRYIISLPWVAALEANGSGSPLVCPNLAVKLWNLGGRREPECNYASLLMLQHFSSL